MKTLTAALLLAALSPALLAADARYPNELDGYKFFAAAKWNTLTPGVSTMADVRKTLGEPKRVFDIAKYGDPYPGDDKATQPVFNYELGAEWTLVIHFGRTDLSAPEKLRAAIPDRLYEIMLVPVKPLSFKDIAFPDHFKKSDIVAADARWNDYRDSAGLSYSVYTSKTRYGKTAPGDLHTITYGLSDEALQQILNSEKDK